MSKTKRSNRPAPLNARRRLLHRSAGVLATVAGIGLTASGALAAAEINVSPAAFNQINLDVPASFTVSIGSPSRVQITAEPKVLKAIRVNSSDGTLTVSTEGSFNTQKPVIITITTPHLKGISAQGAGDITVNSLDSDQLAIDATGTTSFMLAKMNLRQLIADIRESAEVQASGVTASQQITIDGAGSYDGHSLSSMVAKVSVKDAGSADIKVRQTLDVSVSDAGEVVYDGQPTIRQSVSDAGSLETK